MSRTPPAALLWRTAAYTAMILGAIGAFLLIRTYGDTLAARTPVSLAVPFRSTPGATDPLFHVLLALATVLALGRLLARVFAAVHQPPVVGEVVAGVLLGPSLLGRVAPAVSDYVLPLSIAPFLSVIAQFGVILYMFLVGLDLDADL